MKKIKIVLAVLLLSLLCYSPQAFAIDLYGFGSYWEKGDMDGTWGVGLGVSLPIIIDNIRLDGRAHFFEDSDYGRDTVTVTPFDLGVQLHLMPNGGFDPYLLGGVSYNYVDSKHLNLDSKFGGYLGAGVDMELGTSLFKLFGEILYRFSDIENVSGSDLDVSGITANVGLKIHFF
ncbi:MAG: outer membrane beta-barrel protein [Deltaproteobacteria bacterium]|nr:outer membrane beta-barrel protein [Deltaproteobacteria bacterium]